MKKKQIIILISIILLLLITVLGILIYKNEQEKNRKLEEQKIETRYKTVFNNMYKTLDVSTEKIKNKDEKIIKEYIAKIINYETELDKYEYDKFILEKPTDTIFTSVDTYKSSLDSNKTNLENSINNLKDFNSKNKFLEYLKNNKCSKKGITILNKIINEKTFTNDKYDKIRDDNFSKFDKLISYVNYLIENKSNWTLSNNKLIIKNDEILNNISEQNKAFGINIVSEKEKITTTSTGTGVSVIMYHGVSDTTWGIEGLFMKVNDFEQQLKYLSDNNYNTIFIEDIENVTSSSKNIALTFDDGYVDFYNNAFPLLKKYNIKANLYVITSTLYGNEKFVTADQLKEMSNSGLVSVGSHTVSHNQLAGLNAETVEKELKDSKQYLDDLLGKEIKTICYPSGSYNSSVIDIAKKYYKYGIKVGGGKQYINSNFNKYEIKRYKMYRGTGFSAFKEMCG